MWTTSATARQEMKPTIKKKIVHKKVLKEKNGWRK